MVSNAFRSSASFALISERKVVIIPADLLLGPHSFDDAIVRESARVSFPFIGGSVVPKYVLVSEPLRLMCVAKEPLIVVDAQLAI